LEVKLGRGSIGCLVASMLVELTVVVASFRDSDCVKSVLTFKICEYSGHGHFKIEKISFTISKLNMTVSSRKCLLEISLWSCLDSSATDVIMMVITYVVHYIQVKLW
jgi:hypothetical protein